MPLNTSTPIEHVRTRAISDVTEYFAAGEYFRSLARRIAIPTESQHPAKSDEIHRYFTDEIIPDLQDLGFTTELWDNPESPEHPFLFAARTEEPSAPTLLMYGHGDVMYAHPEQWREGLDPWVLKVEGDRIYGRGTADNKGQHSINIAALKHALEARSGLLGYNVKFLFESGEEAGSPGLVEFISANKDLLAADLFIASDGPRVSAEQPTVFLGSRGSINFALRVDLRDRAYHSGNWGGVLRNPGTVLAAAIYSLVDGSGRIQIDTLNPGSIPAAVREALQDIEIDQGPDSPRVDNAWGEPGLTPIERLIAWNTIEVLAIIAGEPDATANAIPPCALGHLQLRFVVGTDVSNFAERIREHLVKCGLPFVEVEVQHVMDATRLDPDHPTVQFALRSIEATLGKKPALLPNLGGSIPNSPFSDILGLPTIWIPHSYPACAQHAADEHALSSISLEGLQIMAGLFNDLSDQRESWAPRPMQSDPTSWEA